MTSTGSGSGSATGTYPTHAVFWPMKPIMGGLVQIKSDTFVTWMGGIPNLDWTDLKISTAYTQQSSQICPMLNNSGFHEWSKGLDVKLSQEKRDLFSFNAIYSSTFMTWVWTPSLTLRIWEIPPRWSLLTDHTQFTPAYVKSAIAEQCKCYDSYNQ